MPPMSQIASTAWVPEKTFSCRSSLPTNLESMEDTDYLIIGGGTAGCTLATRLKEKLPEVSVTVLEAGTDERNNPLITDVMGTFQLHYTDYEYKYATVPQKSYDGRNVFLAAGKMLSGSSACNYGFWCRGSRVEFDLWAAAVGDDRWSYEGQLPYFKRVEKYHDSGEPDVSQHGDSGPMHTSRASDRSYPLGDDLVRTFAEVTGLPRIRDGNAGDPIGIAPYIENWRDGKRQPAGRVYPLTGVDVITSAPVKRVVIENGVAVGAELQDSRQIKARKEIIVSCGAYKSPQLLKLSGLGPKEELARHGIEQAVSNEAMEQVGQNLSDHPAVPMFYRVKYPERSVAVGAPGFNDPSYLLGMPVTMALTNHASSEETKDALIRDGVSGVTDEHAYLRTDRGHWETLTMWGPTIDPLINIDLPVDGTIITNGILALLPTSRGTVTLANADPSSMPLIDPNYFSTETDKSVLRQAIRTSIAAFESSPLADHIEGHHPPPGYAKLTRQSTDAEIDAPVRRSGVTWHHPAGTCAMGKVVDTEGRVMGVKDLRVVDASVFPAPLAGHYQAPTYALAEQMADVIAGKAG